ncbi:hypothetical protein EDD18DRAFT_239731 [Armillaria luteobubalina]|uniref:F-box domain-containing protein n=1 Tax=Armillaria luteobubalina TaxID=153913 RepID=A0AA39NZY6_9AGAR|nr:hypothetical protein EDD18DRAFT_239731 [Armillaria luteobubalina]
MSSNAAALSDICSTCGSITQGTFSGYVPSPRISELLRSNDAPSDTELSNFRDIIKQGPRHIADLDQKIAHTKVFLDALLNKRDLVEANIEAAKVLSSPVRRLPLDILRSITLQTILSPSEIMSSPFSPDSLDTRRCPWTLSQVCRSWRSTIVNSPELWSSISLYMTGSLDQPLSSICHSMFMLGLHLQRSLNAPLSVCLHNDTLDTDHPFLSLISSHAPSIKNLFLYSQQLRSMQGLCRCRGSWNRLRHLKITAIDCRWPIGQIFDAFEYASKLQVFDWVLLQPQYIPLIPWVQLTHLILRVLNKPHLELLRHAKNITSLEVQGTGSIMPEEREPIRLLFLTSLTLRNQSAIVSSLYIPNLTVLSLIYYGRPVFPRLTISNTITTLKITRIGECCRGSGPEEICTFPGLPLLLESVPYIRRLVIESCNPLSLTDVTALTPTPTCTPIPRLQILDLRDCTLGFDHSRFVDMVAIHRLGDKSGIDRLETIHLNAPLELVGVCERTWQSLCHKGLIIKYGRS